MKTKFKNLISAYKRIAKVKLLNLVPIFYYSRVVNFGDVLNIYLVEKLSLRKVYAIKPANFIAKHYLVIGSVLNQTTRNSVIWGTGHMFSNASLKEKPKKVCAVRGPKTRKLLLKDDIECPEIYGDPALLLPKLYNPKIKRKYKIGLIPHYVDKQNPWIKSVADSEQVKVIDIQNSDVESFVDELLECENIISSSLHGVIVADAYNLPSLWVELSNKVAGSGFKFLDYFESVKRNPIKAKLITESTDIDDILSCFEDYSIDINLERLLEACPFYQKNNH